MASITPLKIQSMSNTNMDQNQAETFLKAQSKKKGGVITSDRIDVVLKFWRNHREKIHSHIISRSNWNGLTKWKLDINSYSSSEFSNQPVAVLHLDKQSLDSEVRNQFCGNLFNLTRKFCTEIILFKIFFKWI